MLDIRRLEILHRFAVLGSITAVAGDMGYSPSAISQQLSALEREAGIALLERTAQSAMLTDAGKELAQLALGILSASEHAHSRMRERAGTISGQVNISCIPGLAARLAPQLAMLQRQHPHLTIVAREVGASTAAAAVLQGRGDLAVVDDWTEDAEPSAPGLDIHLLSREQIALAVPQDHGYASRSAPISATVLRQIITTETLLCAPTGARSRAATDLRLAALGIEPARRWEFEGLHILATLVATGAGVALLPASITDQQHGVVGLRLSPSMRRRVIVLTRLSTKHDPALTSCLQAARRALS